MIQNLSPKVRQGLVAARVAGMTRGADEAVAILRLLATQSKSMSDRIAVSLLESEMCALDLQPEQALQVFKRDVEPFLSQLDRRIATVLADNKVVMQMNSLDPSGVRDHYFLVDVRRILGVELRDYSAVLEAARSAEKGQHYESLPVYWQQLRAAYRVQNWRARRFAEHDFAEECLRLGLLDEAAYHAMLAEDKDLIHRVANILMASQSEQWITKSLDRLLSACALKRHVIEVARFLEIIADAIPDARLGKVAEFISRHSHYVPTGWHNVPLAETIWSAIEEISLRFDSDSVSLLIKSAVTHPILGESNHVRRSVIKAMNALTGKAEPKELLSLAETALTLIGEQRSDFDYGDSLNFLCHVASRADAELRERICKTAYPPGKQISDTLLIQVGPHLGWTPPSDGDVSAGAERVAAAVRMQVQRLAPGEEPAKIGATIVQTIKNERGVVVVHLQGAIHWIRALITSANLIAPSAIRTLLEAMIDMISENENAILNRVELTRLLQKLIELCPPELHTRLTNTLEALACGEIVEPSCGQKHAESKDPLNPIKMGAVDPNILRGTALCCLAKLEALRPGTSKNYHERILLSAITSPIAVVRQSGVGAAYETQNLTHSERMAVAFATLDSDAQVARIALDTLGKDENRCTLDSLAWQIIVRSVETAVSSKDASLRRSAARMVKQTEDAPGDLLSRLRSCETQFRADFCYSVRRQLSLR